MVDARIAYISAATNRYCQAADASPSSLVAFGSSSFISLWDTSDEHDRGISHTLPGHNGLVTCVRFLDDNAFFSADDKGVLLFWRNVKLQWNLTAKIQAHTKAVSSVCVYNKCLVTGSSDAFVKVWKIDSTESSGMKFHSRP